jgi:hypothetical protein
MIEEIETAMEEGTINNMDCVYLYEELETLMERKLSQEIVEQQFSKIVVEMEYAVEWQVNSTGDEISMGD